MANLLSTTIAGNTKLPVGTILQRPNQTIIQWTNTGSQAYSVLQGTTPTLTNTTWTCPTGVYQVSALVVAGGGGGGSAGGGGAGGVIYTNSYNVTPGTQYTVTVGAGGAAATTSSTNITGTSGNNSCLLYTSDAADE